MPQIAKYRVAVGLRHSIATLATPTLQTKVPDIVLRDEIEEQLHQRFQNEWSDALRSGKMLDLELAGNLHGPDWAFLVVGNDPDTPGGRIAVHPDEVAWLQTVVSALEPEQPPAPAAGM